MTEEEYGVVAEIYERMSDEPLVADGAYVAPLWDSTHVAVDCDDAFAEQQKLKPGLTDKFQAERMEIARRVAAMIYVQTYGLAALHIACPETP